jgi:gluconolactonase
MTNSASGEWEPSLRYPDPAVRVLDPSFAKYRVMLASVERLATGMRWSEGPAWFGDGRFLLWSDIPNNRIMRWDEATGATSVFRQPSNNANGNTRDRQGRLVTCEHDSRRVTRTEYDGAITVVCDRHDGKRLNSPNDVVVKSDGSIWFTDPPFGILSDYEGHKAESELGKNYVFRADALNGTLVPVADDFVRPNGLAFSPDETRLYIADSHPSQRNLRVYDVADDGAIRNGRVFATCTAGRFDGFRLDDGGRIWTSTDEGVHCYDPDGTLIGKVLVPEVVANVAWGGYKRNRLYICATTSLYAILLPVRGAKTM